MSGLAVSQDIASRLQQAQRHHRQPQHVLILGILTLTAVQNEDAENARVCCIYVPSPTPARADARAAICAPGVCMHWPSNLTSSTALGPPTNHRLFLWAHTHNSLSSACLSTLDKTLPRRERLSFVDRGECSSLCCPCLFCTGVSKSWPTTHYAHYCTFPVSSRLFTPAFRLTLLLLAFLHNRVCLWT
jgi:hypothetical protein